MTAAVHELDNALFDRLAGGLGGASAVEALRTAQLSKHLQLIGYLLDRWPGPASERDAVADALESARTKGADRFHEVVRAPLVGGWAAIVVRAAERSGPKWTDVAHLSAIAMVADAAAGVDGEAQIPVRDGVAAVPGWGVATGMTGERATLTAEAGRLRIRAGDTVVAVGTEEADPRWQPVRQLTAEADSQRLSLGLDDVDPYRHGHHVPPALRLPADEVAIWRELFGEAWRLLAGQMPERAAEVSAGLRTLVPLLHTGDGSARSATIRHAFGVFGLTRPPSAADFVVTIVHEFQHSKLSAMLDLVPMSDPGERRRYFAPWRTDPRPLAGLLQGVYAFVGVADSWRALREVDGIGAMAAEQFAAARMHVDIGLRSIEGSQALTPAGRALVGGLRDATDALLDVPVPPSAMRAAEENTARIRQMWLQRNAGADGV